MKMTRCEFFISFGRLLSFDYNLILPIISIDGAAVAAGVVMALTRKSSKVRPSSLDVAFFSFPLLSSDLVELFLTARFLSLLMKWLLVAALVVQLVGVAITIRTGSSRRVSFRFSSTVSFVDVDLAFLLSQVALLV